MSSKTRGKSTSISEVTNVRKNGIRVFHQEKEYFIPFLDYPAFRNATVEEIYSMRGNAAGQLRWKELDIDIEIDALERPDDFPLVFR